MKGQSSCCTPTSAAGEPIFAAVGKLQFEVMQYRLEDEYGVATEISYLPYECSAWIIGDAKKFNPPSSATIVQDRQGRPMALFSSSWEKQYSLKLNPNHQLVDVLV